MTIYAQRSYLEKHRFAPRQIEDSPAASLGMVVVIPSHCEPALTRTLDSLEQCDPPDCGVEVIVVCNLSKKADESARQQHAASLAAARAWLKAARRNFTYHFLDFPQLPPKHAGVGLARKIGMDEAVDRLEQVDRPEGVIVCLDADSQVQPNYLVTLERAFQHDDKRTACSIHFEHPLEGKAFEPLVYEGIIRYELFLRYYVEGLRFAGYPYAYHTIGSSMAVRSRAYQAESGMNRRKAGEDFYFLHKFTPQPGFFELNDTLVIPSPRPSDKVPFGTGRAIGQWLDREGKGYPAYALQSFQELKVLLEDMPRLYTQAPGTYPPAVASFLDAMGFDEVLPDIRRHVASQAAFEKRFFQWLTPLRALKYVHHSRDQHHPDQPVEQVVAQLGRELGADLPADASLRQWLSWYRTRQRGISKDD
jgi:hypothetical protein